MKDKLYVGALVILILLALGMVALGYKYKAMTRNSKQSIATPTVSRDFTCDEAKTFKADFANNSLIAVLHLADNHNVTLERMNEENLYANEGNEVLFLNSGKAAYVSQNGVKTYQNCK